MFHISTNTGGGLFIDSVHTSVQRTGTVEPR